MRGSHRGTEGLRLPVYRNSLCRACSGDGCKNKPLVEARGLLKVLERDYLPVFSIVMPPGVCWFFFSSFALRVAMVLSRH